MCWSQQRLCQVGGEEAGVEGLHAEVAGHIFQSNATTATKPALLRRGRGRGGGLWLLASRNTRTVFGVDAAIRVTVTGPETAVGGRACPMAGAPVAVRALRKSIGWNDLGLGRVHLRHCPVRDRAIGQYEPHREGRQQ